MASPVDGGQAVEFTNLEVTQDAVDRRKAFWREQYKKTGGNPNFDQSQVLNKKVGYSYHGVNIKDERRVAWFQSQGWEAVAESDPELWKAQRGVENGVKMLGSEQGLYRIPNDKRIDNLARAQILQEQREGQFIDVTREKMEEMVREALPRMTRDVTFDDSKQGPMMEKTMPRPRRE
jgi:hypothetical protein